MAAKTEKRLAVEREEERKTSVNRRGGLGIGIGIGEGYDERVSVVKGWFVRRVVSTFLLQGSSFTEREREGGMRRDQL